MESLMKLPFQRVVIYPKRTPDEEVMVVLLRHYALSRDISERTALKDFTITLHTDLQNSRFLMRWKVDLMELQNNLLFAHGTSLILDEKLITTVTLHRLAHLSFYVENNPVREWMEYGRSNRAPVLDEADDDGDVPLPSHIVRDQINLSDLRDTTGDACISDWARRHVGDT